MCMLSKEGDSSVGNDKESALMAGGGSVFGYNLTSGIGMRMKKQD